MSDSGEMKAREGLVRDGIGWRPTLKPKSVPLLAEPQAWLRVAELFAVPWTPSTHNGLCYAIRHMYFHGLIAPNTMRAMGDRVREMLPSGGYAYCAYNGGCDTSRGARDARCMAALWFALDAEAEAV